MSVLALPSRAEMVSVETIEGCERGHTFRSLCSQPLRNPIQTKGAVVMAVDTDDEELSGYARALGARLRAIRTQQHLSLHGVERKSGGKWKAVVVGSYERGDRSVTVAKLAELAEFYGVPVSELLPEGSS